MFTADHFNRIGVDHLPGRALLGHHLDKVSVTEPIGEIPAHT